MCCSKDHGGVRHEPDAETYPFPVDSGRWCKCKGHPDNEPGGYAVTCCGAFSADDGLCDRCRTTCKAEPVAQVLVDHDVYPPLGPELVDAIAGAEPVVV